MYIRILIYLSYDRFTGAKVTITTLAVPILKYGDITLYHNVPKHTILQSSNQVAMLYYYTNIPY